MKNRVIYSFLVASLTALMMLACTDDIIVDGEDGKTNPVYAEGWGTCFSSGISEDIRAADGPRKISVNYDMKYFWTYGDYIWVKDGSTFLKSDSSSIPENTLEHDAHFYFRKKLENEKYEIRYTGNGGVNGRRADSVHITAVQVQTKLGSGHVGQYGDCGVDTAKKDTEGKYTFNLKHKASFLLFTPTKSDAGKSVKLRSIKVTKLNCTPGDSAICGSYYFDADGLQTGTAMKNAGKSITLNLFTTDDNGNENYWYELPSSKKPDSCLYMVLQPGNHRLSVEYELVQQSGNLQVVTHNKTTDKYEYSYDNTAQKWKKARELKNEAKPDKAHTFTPNGFTKVAHKIDENFHFRIPYTYYQWGAASWCLKRVDDYPTNSNPADAANYVKMGMPIQYNMTKYNDYNTTSSSACSDFMVDERVGLIGEVGKYGFYNGNNPYSVKNECDYGVAHDFGFWAYAKRYIENSGFSSPLQDNWFSIFHTQEYQVSVRHSIGRMPSANEMTYYLKYGDIHRDNTALWSIDGYRGDSTMCRGGIWIKKRKVIEAEGHPFSTEKSAYQINGSDLDLRYQSPGSNYMFRHYNEDAQVPATEAAEGAVADVKYGMPADTSKYFFLPLLGYMHNVANSTKENGEPSHGHTGTYPDNKVEYKFVGAEGYYWTRTMWPNAYFPGEESKKPASYNMHGEREAYYLRITPYYVALCWDMRANRMHGFVGNERPDWYRNMPESERVNVWYRYVSSYSGYVYEIRSINDTWFQ